MLRRNNSSSLTQNADSSRPTTSTTFESTTNSSKLHSNLAKLQITNTNNSELCTNNVAMDISVADSATEVSSVAAQKLTAAILESYAPPIDKVKGHLKELIQKQNKIYIDLSAEKFKVDNAEIVKLRDMMNNVKVYREKLLKIKKQMQNIYQRTKVLKKRANNIQTCKERELQRKLQKQQQEEALIGKQPQ